MTKKYIEILHVAYLRGPSMWTYRPALEALVDIGDLEDCPSNTIPGFYERLSSWLPGLIEHKCSIGERGGFLQRVKDGTWPAHILEHVTLELQNLAGQRTGFGKARSTSRRGVYKVVVRSRQEAVTRACLYAARDLVMAAIENRPFDVVATVAPLRDMADRLCLGPSTAAIVDAAADRGIPAIRLNGGNLVQLGFGAKSRRIWTAETDATSAIAESIAGDKDLTKRLLASCGIPIPEGREVDSAADAWEAAEDIGVPVVVKPTDGNHGRGVFTDLSTREEIEKAYAAARGEGSGVMVERFVRGVAHRLLVVGRKVAAATKGKTVSVVGDGHSTVLQLVESQVNSDPRCGVEEEFPIEPLVLTEEPIALLELERQGLAPEAVPDTGREVLLKRQGDLAYDVTDEVHPEVAAIAALAARVVGLDVAGIDLVVEDITRPLAPQGGAIVEVNAGPSLLMHLKPAEGKPRPVGQAIVDNLFPAKENGRVPVVGVTGSRGRTTVAKLVARLLSLSGKPTGLACSEGLYMSRRRVEEGDRARWEPAHRLLKNRSLEAIVIENGLATIVEEGLAYDRCQVAVVTGIDGDDLLPDRYIEDADHQFNVLRTQVDVVLPGGAAVLDADDPVAMRMGELCDGEVILFGDATRVSAQLARKGGRGLYERDDQIILAEGGKETMLTTVTAVPLAATPAGLAQVLAGLGAAWALGISCELMRAGIEAFDPAN